MERPRSFAPIIAAVLLLLPVIYVGSYLALVRPGGILYRWNSVEYGVAYVRVEKYPYIGVGSWGQRIYWPLEQIDRRMRPASWKSQEDLFWSEERYGH